MTFPAAGVPPPRSPGSDPGTSVWNASSLGLQGFRAAMASGLKLYGVL